MSAEVTETVETTETTEVTQEVATETTQQPDTKDGVCEEAEALENYIKTNQQALERLSTLEKQALGAIESIVALSGGFDKNIEQITTFFSGEEADVSLGDGESVPNIIKAYNTLNKDIKALKDTLTQEVHTLKDAVTANVSAEIERLSTQVSSFIARLEAKEGYSKEEINVFMNALQKKQEDMETEITTIKERLESGDIGTTPLPNTITLQKPIIQQPSNSQNDFSGAFVVSAIVPSEEVGSFTLRIQVSKQSDFSSISFNQTLNDSNTLNLSLEPNTNYYVRARYEVGLVFSEYSEAVQFRTANVYIATPNISVEGDSSGKIVLNPTIQGSEFRVINGSDRHIATTIKLKEQGASRYIVDKKIMSPITEYQLESPLEINKTYVFEMVYHGENYVSATGTTTKTTQNIFIKTPTLTLDTTSGLRVTTSAFECVNGEDTHKSTKYTIKKGGIAVVNENSTTNLTSASFALESNGEYILEVVHIGNTYGESLKATKTFNYTKPRVAIQAPEVVGEQIKGKVVSSHFAFYYGNNIDNNQKFQQAKFEVYRDSELAYALEFGKNINYEASGNGTLTSQTLTTEEKRSLASGVEEAYKAFDNNSSTKVIITGRQSIILEYKNAVFLRRFNIASVSGKEPREIKLWGETTLGWNLLEHQISTAGTTLTYTISDLYNAYKKFKMEFIAHRSGNTSEITAINFYTQNPPEIALTIKNEIELGEWLVRMGHKVQGTGFVFGAKKQVDINQQDFTKQYLGYIERETNINLIRALNTGYEEDWRLKSIPSAVLNTGSFTPEYRKLKARLPFAEMKNWLVDIATGDRELLKTTVVSEIQSKASAKDSLCIMTRILKTYYIAGTVTYNSKTFYILCVGGEPFEITLTPEMLHGSTQNSSTIYFSPLFQPHNYPAGVAENNNTKIVKITSSLHPAFHGKVKICDELFLSADAIYNGRYNVESWWQGATPAQHRANIATLAKGNADKNSIWDFWTAQLLLILMNVASQNERQGRNQRNTSAARIFNNEWLLSNGNNYVFFGLSSLFHSVLFIDGVIATTNNFKVAHADSLFGNEVTSDYSSDIHIPSYYGQFNKILGTNYPSSRSNYAAFDWRSGMDFTYGWQLNSTVYTRSVFREWRQK